MKVLKLKSISPELKSKFIKHLCETTSTKLNLEVAFNVNDGIRNFIFFSNNEYSSDKILQQLNLNVSNELWNFIESETGESAKEYDRSIALFESDSNDVNLTITW